MYIGNNEIKGLAIGNSPVIAIYQGTTPMPMPDSGDTPTPPANYTQIQYTQTNFRWFNTEIVPAAGIKVVLDFELTSFNGSYRNNMIFGSWPYGYDSSKTLAFSANSGRKQFSYYCAGGYEDYAGNYTVGNRYTVELSEYECVITEDGGTPQQHSIGETNEESNKPILLGCVWPNPNDNPEPTNIKIYEGWIYSGNTLIAHYLPYTNGNNEEVLYDNISNVTLYYTDEIPVIVSQVDLYVNGDYAVTLQYNNDDERNPYYYADSALYPFNNGDELTFYVDGEQIEYYDENDGSYTLSTRLNDGDTFNMFEFKYNEPEWRFSYDWGYYQ